ncbi:IclR family transcriptional regulator [Rhodococcus sp. NPDC058521]|uniref:IclR family transcriptional regulator n=1 Tax=Rhodococcus sp. NPDC058521 TaxID=3346536 RepID=UPI0036573D46
MTTLLSHDSDVTETNSLPLSMVERMTLIMEAFDRPLARLTLDDVTQHTGLPRSTAHRILDQLVQCRWLIHAKTHYSLGSRALTLGGRERTQHELRSAAANVLQALARHTGLCVHLTTLAGSEVYFLDMFGAKYDQRTPLQVGGRAPAHCTAAGKAIMAGLTPEYVDSQFTTTVRGRQTARSIHDMDTLHQELARIRARNGLAVEHGEYLPHLSCIGAAIRGPEGPVGSISVATRHDGPIRSLAPIVLRAARSVSNTLAHNEVPH